MLCQGCASLLRGSRAAVAAPTRVAKRALSIDPAKRGRALSIATSAAAWQYPPLRNRTTVSMPSPAARRFHPATAFHKPAASSAESESAPSSTTPEKPDFLDEAESVIWDRLVAEFSPVELVVQDISGGCGSMYGIEISSEKFRGANMLKQQRMVNAVLGDLMKGWHGCQLKTRVPS